jgi:hypothetical protein
MSIGDAGVTAQRVLTPVGDDRHIVVDLEFDTVEGPTGERRPW